MSELQLLQKVDKILAKELEEKRQQRRDLRDNPQATWHSLIYADGRSCFNGAIKFFDLYRRTIKGVREMTKREQFKNLCKEYLNDLAMQINSLWMTKNLRNLQTINFIAVIAFLISMSKVIAKHTVKNTYGNICKNTVTRR